MAFRLKALIVTTILVEAAVTVVTGAQAAAHNEADQHLSVARKRHIIRRQQDVIRANRQLIEAQRAQIARSASSTEAPAVAVTAKGGVVGYFGPPAAYQGDVGFALLGLLNGGGFRGFVECGHYYSRSPGACGF